MPVQEEERSSSSTSEWDFIPVGRRRWIDIEVQNSKDLHCFQMSKFIMKLPRHKNVGREGDAGFPHSRIVEECKKVLSEDSKYWTEETRQRLVTAPYWSANMWIEVLAKGGGNKKRFLKPDDPDRLLYLRAIQGHSEKAYSGNAPIDPALQDGVQLQKDFTKYV